MRSTALVAVSLVARARTVAAARASSAVECVSAEDAAPFLTTLGATLGWTRSSPDAAAILLTERGQYEDIREFDHLYLWTDVNGVLLDLYDGMRATYRSGQGFAAQDMATSCELERNTVVPCIESCVRDRLWTADDEEYAECATPLETTFLNSPDLAKACLVDPNGTPFTLADAAAYARPGHRRALASAEDCFSCVSLCIGASRTLGLSCDT